MWYLFLSQEDPEHGTEYFHGKQIMSQKRQKNGGHGTMEQKKKDLLYDASMQVKWSYVKPLTVDQVVKPWVPFQIVHERPADTIATLYCNTRYVP